MKKIVLMLMCCSFFAAFGQVLKSPSEKLTLRFSLDVKGVPEYELDFVNSSVVSKSKLGISLKGETSLVDGFSVLNWETSAVDQTWEPVLGEQSEIRDHYNQASATLLQKESGKKLIITFRIFDEGLAFRYEFPTEKKVRYFVVSKENTEFNLIGDHKTFWIPGDYDSQEYVYNETKLSEVDNQKLDMNNGIALKSIDGRYRIQSPLMMKTKEGLYVNVFEAAVINYPVMHLDLNPKNFQLKVNLAPNPIGDKAYLRTPSVTPWRTIMVSDDARDIVSSKMILNLNDPNVIEDTSWIKPMKYIGIWWEMHVGVSTWDYAGGQNALNAQSDDLIPSGRHGATTENTKKYIDFAAKHGFDGVLVEGWNVGWEDWFGNWKEDVFDFLSPYPDFDLNEVSTYAKSKGIKMIMHHETSGSTANYERHLDRAFTLMKKYDYPAVKSGYVGKIIPRGEFHDGQAMVNHFNFVAKRAADYKIMLNSHESVRPTGISRTYPNYFAAEAARGNEFNAWSSGNPPAHETILPFTRLLGGAMDYTPGIFEVKMSHYDAQSTARVQTTLAKQLALYVTMYSPLQMAADLPENYEKYADAFQFIKEVALDWQSSIYLEAEPGDYLTVARKEKNSENWFIGAITDENPRKTILELSFLSPGKKYQATIYKDAKNADWERNPKRYVILKKVVSNTSKIKLKLAPGGGAAISIIPID